MKRRLYGAVTDSRFGAVRNLCVATTRPVGRARGTHAPDCELLAHFRAFLSTGRAGRLHIAGNPPGRPVKGSAITLVLAHEITGAWHRLDRYLDRAKAVGPDQL